MSAPKPSTRRVAVVYHFFAHYRAAVMRTLCASERFHFVMVADEAAPARLAMKLWTDYPPDRFVRARCMHLGGPFMLQLGLVRLALRRDLDAIIYLGNPFWPCTWLSAALARLCGKRVLFWTHGWVRRHRGLRRWICFLFYRIAHGLLLYGHVAKMIGIEEGFAPERLYVVYNSLDYDAQRAARQAIAPQRLRDVRHELFPGSDRPMAICTTRLVPVRRLDLLLEALALLKADGHPVDLLLVGDGPERDALTRLAAERELSVHFFGACYDESRLAELVMAAHVTVAPGKVGLTAMHSLAFGTPVITHGDADNQMPEWEAIIPGRSGGLVKHHDVADLAGCIRRWTAASRSEGSDRAACHAVIDRFYNPRFQRRVIERALDGLPADDLFWMHERDG